jgi:hypothetical protein
MRSREEVTVSKSPVGLSGSRILQHRSIGLSLCHTSLSYWSRSHPESTYSFLISIDSSKKLLWSYSQFQISCYTTNNHWFKISSNLQTHQSRDQPPRLATTDPKNRWCTDSSSPQKRHVTSSNFSLLLRLKLVFWQKPQEKMNPRGIISFQTAEMNTCVIPLKFITLYSDWDE